MNSARTADSIADIVHPGEDYQPTSLLELPALAQRANVARVFVKAESERPLGNFKVLGGMFAGLRALARTAGGVSIRELASGRHGTLPPLICASDGNHGLAVAAAAKRAGTKACIYLPAQVSPVRAQRIEALGGEIVRIRGTYDDAVDEAARAAARGDGLLISDTSNDANDAIVRDVMAGYTLITRELIAQFGDELRTRPSHVFVQAGVGGLAAGIAQGLADFLRTPGKILTVEPESAACVTRALEVGRPTRISADLHTAAEMLSCGVASAPAIEILLRHGAQPVVVPEENLHRAVTEMRQASGPDTTPSGAAGLAGLLHVADQSELRAIHQLGEDSTVLLIATEGPLKAPR
jgi:diaminopropionate ammonia-lyase